MRPEEEQGQSQPPTPPQPPQHPAPSTSQSTSPPMNGNHRTSPRSDDSQQAEANLKKVQQFLDEKGGRPLNHVELAGLVHLLQASVEGEFVWSRLCKSFLIVGGQMRMSSRNPSVSPRARVLHSEATPPQSTSCPQAVRNRWCLLLALLLRVLGKRWRGTRWAFIAGKEVVVRAPAIATNRQALDRRLRGQRSSWLQRSPRLTASVGELAKMLHHPRHSVPAPPLEPRSMDLLPPLCRPLRLPPPLSVRRMALRSTVDPTVPLFLLLPLRRGFVRMASSRRLPPYLLPFARPGAIPIHPRSHPLPNQPPNLLVQRAS